MRTLGAVFLVAAMAILPACSSSPTSPSQPTEQTLAGTWRATTMQYSNLANASQTVEVVSKGTTAVLVLDTGGSFTFTIAPSSGPATIFSGTWNASGDVLTLLPTQWQGNVQFEMVFSGNSLTLTEGHMPYDVNNDTLMEECLVNLTMARQ